MRLTTSVLFTLFMAGAVLADPQAIRFQPSTSSQTVTGEFSGYSTKDYSVNAKAGQVLRFDLTSDPSNAYLNIFRPGDKAGSSTALLSSSSAGNSAEITLPASGDYLIQVHQMRATARREGKVSFDLKISVGPAAARKAEALAGGPDWWQVAGISNSVNIRAAASSGAAIVGSAALGAPLRNSGCNEVGGARWCKVETTTGVKGWVAGKYLQEGAEPGTAPAPEPEFDATGQVPCALKPGQASFQCKFGIKRLDAVKGDADITVFWPEGSGPEMAFRDGRLATFSARAERRGPLSVVYIDGERYEIPDSVIYGN